MHTPAGLVGSKRDGVAQVKNGMDKYIEGRVGCEDVAC
jgi:hypothetical protein